MSDKTDRAGKKRGTQAAPSQQVTVETEKCAGSSSVEAALNSFAAPAEQETFKITVEGEVFIVPSGRMTSASKYFETLRNSEFSESHGLEVTLQDESKGEFSQVLKLIMSDDLPSLLLRPNDKRKKLTMLGSELDSELHTWTTEDVEMLEKWSDKYLMDEIAFLCKVFRFRKIGSDADGGEYVTKMDESLAAELLGTWTDANDAAGVLIHLYYSGVEGKVVAVGIAGRMEVEKLAELLARFAFEEDGCEGLQMQLKLTRPQNQLLNIDTKHEDILTSLTRPQNQLLAYTAGARYKELWWAECIDDECWCQAAVCLCSMERSEAVKILASWVEAEQGCAGPAAVVTALLNFHLEGAEIAASLPQDYDELLAPTLAHCAQETDAYDNSMAGVPDQVLHQVTPATRMVSIDQRMHQIMRQRRRTKRSEDQQFRIVVQQQQIMSSGTTMFGHEQDEGGDQEDDEDEGDDEGGEDGESEESFTFGTEDEMAEAE